jgi:DNA-binding IscR family transcriptional regulator
VAVFHSVTRAAYEALPADGSLVPLRDVRRRLGIPRQYVNYHVAKLVESGLAEIVDAGRHGSRAARRLQPVPAAPAASAAPARRAGEP